MAKKKKNTKDDKADLQLENLFDDDHIQSEEKEEIEEEDNKHLGLDEEEEEEDEEDEEEEEEEEFEGDEQEDFEEDGEENNREEGDDERNDDFSSREAILEIQAVLGKLIQTEEDYINPVWDLTFFVLDHFSVSSYA